MSSLFLQRMYPKLSYCLKLFIVILLASLSLVALSFSHSWYWESVLSHSFSLLVRLLFVHVFQWTIFWFYWLSQLCFSQFSHSVVSDSLQPHGLQHTRLPCPSPTPRACSNPCPSSRWCHPTISASVVVFSCFQSFPASEPFPMSHFFTSGGQSIGVSDSTSVLPMKHSGLSSFRRDWLDLL